MKCKCSFHLAYDSTFIYGKLPDVETRLEILGNSHSLNLTFQDK